MSSAVMIVCLGLLQNGDIFTVFQHEAGSTAQCIGSQFADTQRIHSCIESFGLPIRTDYSADEIARYAVSDKKRSGGSVNLILPRRIGDCAIVTTPVETLKSIIEEGL